MRILLSNDDGVNAKGIIILQEALSDIAEVVVVAPLEERSASGHTITLHDPLRLTEFRKNIYGCSGYPADCVLLGVNHLMKDNPPDLIISGINRGANMAQDIYYSGTVAAAREGAVLGIPSIALSLALRPEDFIHEADSIVHYETAALFVRNLIKKGGHRYLEPSKICNINVPNLAQDKIKGIKITFPGFIEYPKNVETRVDVRNRIYFWVGGKHGQYRRIPGSDCQAIIDQCISLSTLKLSMHSPDRDSEWSHFFDEEFKS